ncbi:MAG: 3-deoxy-manno-octulosonate cytidylyltransferase [Candidatus Omnitrophica bacterium]|nr:3-deoxy-manno-octulosonate cytidylyltransferase [Candidatus Omnitrophota bacterium]
MKVIGVIPARFSSTRLKGKVLAMIDGKPMIQHVYERVRQSQLLNDVLIACDDERVKKAAQEFGAKVVMTDPNHVCGTDRIVEAVKDLNVDIVVNIQGDEPMIDPVIIDDLINALKENPDAPMATVIKKVTDSKDLDNPNIVKVVVDHEQTAIYFSRSKIPFNRAAGEYVYFKHLGIYAYTKEFLLKYAALPKSKLEMAESLEQLRAVENGFKIKTVLTDIETIGVDTPEDLIKVEKLIQERKR